MTPPSLARDDDTYSMRQPGLLAHRRQWALRFGWRRVSDGCPLTHASGLIRQSRQHRCTMHAYKAARPHTVVCGLVIVANVGPLQCSQGVIQVSKGAGSAPYWLHT